ncbi:MAG TPA: zf-HC2 domain-containing protein [Anaerolineales bacterium]|jgi:hypothetical protein
MNQHVLELLPAYHDGQLNPERQEQVKAHLQTCPACVARLEELESLSSLLKSDTPPGLLHPDRFAAQVILKLPRLESDKPGGQATSIPRRLLAAPLIIIIVWAFLQAALLITSVLLWAGWVLGLEPINLPGALVLDFGGLLLLNLVVLAFVTAFWTVWLAFWWLWNKQRVFETAPNRI